MNEIISTIYGIVMIAYFMTIVVAYYDEIEIPNPSEFI